MKSKYQYAQKLFERKIQIFRTLRKGNVGVMFFVLRSTVQKKEKKKKKEEDKKSLEDCKCPIFTYNFRFLGYNYYR